MKDKILIVCSADVWLSAAAHRLAEKHGAEIVSINDAEKITALSNRMPIPLSVPPVVIDMPFHPPLTRAERRKQNRKK